MAGKYKRRKYKRKIQRSSNVYIYLPYGYCRCRRGVDEESIWSRNRRAEWNFTNVWQRKLRYEVGLACALATFKKTARRLEKGEISLKCPLRMICTIDEEGDMTARPYRRTGIRKKEDYVLDLEPTDGEIQMAHKGRLWFHVHVKGITAHASKPEKGADAIFAASKFIVQIQEIFEHFPVHEELGYSTITFGQIQGGYQPYVVPDACTIFIDCG